jgi:starch synthase
LIDGLLFTWSNLDMKIMMITSEAVPFAKTGGLADVVTALSQELALAGNDVKIIIPYYGFIPAEGIENLPWNINLTIDSIDTTFRIAVKTIDSVEFIFFQHTVFTDRSGIYGNSGSLTYSDNMFRFTLFSYAVFEICRRINWYPDIFHCHDWPTGMVPPILKKYSSNSSYSTFKHSASVMTIHNLGYQGKFSKHDIHLSGLDSESIIFPADTDSAAGKEINFLASGILFSNNITTVSETYAAEIQSEDFGEGLHELLASRSDDILGILNGVDYSEWNPENDSLLPVNYSAHDQKNKNQLKLLLQQEMQLKEDPSVPLIGMVSRLADQKGFRELCGGKPSALERIISDYPIQMVIVGTGEMAIEQALTELSLRYPNLSVKITFSNYLAHLIEAGSDFFLMPSRYEPCGLNQIYSLRYGTIPIVRRTGGLADTVKQFSDDYSEGTGLVFDLMSGEAVYQSMQEVMKLWKQPEEILRDIRSRTMEERFLWKSSAHSYVQVYETALQTHKGVQHD